MLTAPPYATPATLPLLRRQVWLVAVSAIVAAVAMLLPLEGVHLPHRHYLPLHTTLEFVSIAASFLVFATVWHTPTREEFTFMPR